MGQKLKIWIPEIGEPLPLEEGVRLHRYGKFSRYLAERGHEVTWWTSGFSHAPKKHIVPDTKVFQIAPNLRLYALKGLGYPRNISVRRFAHQRDFARQFLEKAKLESPPDVILAPIPTLEGSSAAVSYALQHGVPYLVDVRDRWPGEFVDLLPKPARWMGPLIFRKWFGMAKYICKNATAFTGVSSNFMDYGLSFAGRTKSELDTVIPIGYQKDPLSEEARKAGLDWVRSLGLKDEDFVVCFFGTIGRFFDLETVIRVARGVKDRPIKFILAGAGGALDRFKREAADLENVIFPGWIRDAQIQAVLDRSSVGIAPYRKGTAFAMTNKPFEYMAGGLSLLVSFRGELADQIVRERCGFVYEADNSEDLKTRLLELYENRSLQQEMAKNSLRVFKENYGLDTVLPRFEELICRVASQGSRRIICGNTPGGQDGQIDESTVL